MARILFISDSLLNEGLGIMYLSSVVKQAGHSVDLILLQDYETVSEVITEVENYDPNLVGFSVMTPQANTFLPISQEIKEQTNKTVIWGGPHCMFLSDEIVGYGCVDIVCVGDGEDALLELMNRIDEGKNYSDVPSLFVKKEDMSWVKNPLGPLSEDLDKYPFPDRSLYYNKYPLLGNFPLKRVISSRGCPYKCSYCFEPTYAAMYKGKGKIVRRHSVHYVISEIQHLIEKYPTNHIHFSDDIFNLNKRWVYEFADQYTNSVGPGLKWTCNVELTSIDDQLIKSMSESGCRGVVFGLETGVEETRIRVLNKKITNRRYEEITKLFHKYDIKFLMNIMFCLPGETLSHAIESVRFAISLKGYGIRPCMLKVYKGTELAKYVLFSGLTEGVGNLTLKTKDPSGEFPVIENMQWAATIFSRFPFLLRFANQILTSKFARLGKYIIFLNHWEDVKFFQVPLLQAIKYFLASRKLFTEGVAKVQHDVFDSDSNNTQSLGNEAGVQVVQKGGCPSNWNPVGIRDWHGNDPVEVYLPYTESEGKNIYSTIEMDILEKLDSLLKSDPYQAMEDIVTFSDITFLDGNVEFCMNSRQENLSNIGPLKDFTVQTVEEMPGISSATCELRVLN